MDCSGWWEKVFLQFNEFQGVSECMVWCIILTNISLLIIVLSAARITFLWIREERSFVVNMKIFN